MSGIQSKKITQHTKGENTHYKERKDQSVETDPEMIQMIELVESDIKKLSLFCIISRRGRGKIEHIKDKKGILKYPTTRDEN